MMTHRCVAIMVLAALGAAGRTGAADDVRLNQIQVIGTHNSYHIAPHPNVMGLIAAGGKGLAEGLDYTHPPLGEQFSRLGIRQIELDVFADPRGGHYAEPSARKLLKLQGKDPGPDPDEGGRLRKPGLKVIHVQDVDYISTTPTFVDALKAVRAWSAAHPRHVPIMVLVELKDQSVPTLATRPVRFGKDELDSVDAEILSVFSRGEILAPDDVRGSSETLPEALKSRGWPSLDSARGKVMFALDNEGALRDLYLEGHPALRGRLLFTTVAPEHSAAAWMKVNDPVRDFDRIQSLVRDGFLVRTRADADTRQARKNDPSQRDKALASGAQYVSTDYAEPRPEFSGYKVRLPNDVVARSNPINGSKTTADLEGSSPAKFGEDGFADSNGVKIHYVTAGKGPLVVMIHGFPDFWYTWREQMPALAEHFQVVAIDQRGYNLSDKPEGVGNYAMDKLVGDVLAVIKHFKREKAIIVGHDWGGAVAWTLAMTHPEAVDRLIVLNLPHPKGLARELANNPEQQKNSQYAREFQKPDAAQKVLPRMLTLWVKDKEARAVYLEAFRRSSIEGMLNYYKANYPREGAKDDRQYPTVKCPVLLIHGLKDPALLPGALNETWKWVDNELTLLTIPGAGHFVQQDASERVTRAMLSWLPH
jgi:pimeloyl-ACP methyl ester carboxylesterase